MGEIVYVLINGAMPDLVKIGRTNDLERRIRDLDTTSIPLPFECFFACTVPDAAFAEKQLHETFADRRVRDRREFFRVDPQRAVAALKLVAITDVTPKKDFVETPEDQKALDLARNRGGIFNFQMVGIPVGAELEFVYDPNIKVRVVDNRSVEFNGEVTSLSRAAQKAMNVSWQVRGPLYWMYEGETLNERRERMEAQG